MAGKNRKLWILLLVLASAIAGALAHWSIFPPPLAPPPEIRTEIVEKMVPVEVVKEIEVLTPGPERVVERIIVKTEEIPVDREVIRTVFRDVCDEGPPLECNDGLPAFRGLADADLTKFEGTVDGKLRRGYVGPIWCSFSTDCGESYTEIFRGEIDKTESVIQSTDEPGTLDERLSKFRWEVRLGLNTAPGVDLGATFYGRRRIGAWGQVSYHLDPFSGAEFRGFDPFSGSVFQKFSEDKLRLAAGFALSIGRR